MKLKDCVHGILVQDRNGDIGMIVGITNNCETADQNTRAERERAIPLVQWSHGGTCGIHPDNIELLK